MSGFVVKPPTIGSNVFNPSFYTSSTGTTLPKTMTGLTKLSFTNASSTDIISSTIGSSTAALIHDSTGVVFNTSGSFVVNRGSVVSSSVAKGALHINSTSPSGPMPAGMEFYTGGNVAFSSGVPGGLGISLYTASHVWVSGSVLTTSDQRLKTNIEDIKLEEAKKLLDIRTVKYNWTRHNSASMTTGEAKTIGVLAQDLIANGLGEYVGVLPDEDMDDGVCLTVKYQELMIPLITLVQDLQAQINDLAKSSP